MATATIKQDKNLARKEAWIIFLVTTFSVSLLMSLAIHGILGPSLYEVGQVAKTTVRSPFDIIIERDTKEGSALFSEIKRGEVIVRAGDRVTKEQHLKLSQIKNQKEPVDPLRIWGGYFILTAVLLLSSFYYFVKFYQGFRPNTKDLVLLSITLILSLGIIQFFSFLGHAISETGSALQPDTFLLAAPLATGGMVLQIIVGAPYVLLWLIIFSVLTGIFLDNSWLFLVLIISGNLIAASGVKRCTRRSVFLRSGLRVATLNALVVLSFVLLYGELWTEEKLYRMVYAIIGGFFSGILSASLIPLVEFFGKYTTDMKLLELSSLDHPLLRELSLQAPGTWNHSMVVGHMGEAAAEAIHANSLLVRVGAYYHDIGKSKYPAYFIENQQGENRHDKITPSMSALVIKAHVKDGLEMANEHRLPLVISDMILQHHGTSLIEFFYDKAKRDAEEDEIVEEVNFRYTGPKPQTKEAAILMLADSIEATSRSLPDPTPAKLQGLVQKSINRIFVSGELDESGLTLRDLHVIAKYFVRVLTGIYHKRVEYPEASEKVSKDKKNKLESSAATQNNKTTTNEEIRNNSQTQDFKETVQNNNKTEPQEDAGDTLRRLGITSAQKH